VKQHYAMTASNLDLPFFLVLCTSLLLLVNFVCFF